LTVGAWASVIVLAASAALSLGASWLLVSRLEWIAKRLGSTEALLGILAAFAANAPEITTSVTALVHHQREVGAGVILGSNVFNLAALLGLGAIAAGRINLHRKVIVLAGAVATWVAFVGFGSVSHVVSAGVGLAACCVVFVPFVAVLASPRLRGWLPLARSRAWLSAAVTEEELELDDAVRPRSAHARDLAVAVLAIVVVVTASIVMERAATTLSSRISMPPIVLGGVLLAAVTSLPNAVAAIYLARRGRGAATLSTSLNSNSLNVIAGLLVPATILGLAARTSASVLISGWAFGLTVVCLVLAYLLRGLHRAAGWLIVALYVAFVAALLVTT